MRIQVIFGILWMFIGGATGLLFHDPVVCRFTETNQCYVALGQRLHLQMVEEDVFYLILSSNTSTNHFILKYTKTKLDQPKPNSPRWQFVNDNKTMILSSAERNDSGTYLLAINDADGNIKKHYKLQLNIEAEVSSVKVSYSCLSHGIRKVYCSADGDNLRFHGTSDLNLVSQLEDGISTFLLEQSHGNVTCYVENHVSSEQNSTELHPCLMTSFTQSNTGFMVFLSVWLFEVIILLSLLVGAFYIYTRIYRKQRITDRNDEEAL
ncbi:uncharacterized protein LOC113540583 [Pangasianodon hypophthalmus]|uniref:uncharacterized protein LOC113540583 n=1 Tax=Pangasianodon hypophthalmus TaxID=310915 RepID=UPI00147DB3AE|nr:uncharacterized protein LOC113540583 [Pangasianodon hypophthalmus]